MALSSLSNDYIIAVDVTFVPNVARGTDPGAGTIFKFSDQAYFYKPDTGNSPIVTYRHPIKSISKLDFSRVAGRALRGASSVSGGLIEIIATDELLTALSGQNCERQSLVIKKGSRLAHINTFETVFEGLAIGHEIDGTTITIRPFDLATLFNIDFQHRTWLGLGRTIHVGAASGGITVDPPSPATLWDATDSGFSGEWLVQFDNAASADEEIVSRAGVFRLIRQADGKIFFEYFDNAPTRSILLSEVALAANTLYEIVFITALNSGFTLLALSLRDEFGVILDLDVIAAMDIDETPVTTPFVFGGNGTDQMSGLIHYARWWTGVHRSIAETLGIEDVPDDDPGLELQLRMDEGIGGKTSDRIRPLVGVLEGSAAWKTTGTGDLRLRGQRKPSAYGHETNADPVLIDEIEQIYALHYRSNKDSRPKVGGRFLAKTASTTGTVSFIEADSLMKGTPGGIDLTNFVSHQEIEVTGSTLNNVAFRLAETPRLIGTTWEVRLIGRTQSPFEEPSAAGVTIKSITSFSDGLTEEVTGDFDAADRTFTADLGFDLSGFEPFSKVTVAGSASNNFTYAVDDVRKNSSKQWVLTFASAPFDETSTTVTLLQVVDTGEYVLGPDPGQFTLNFMPQKRITVEVFGDDVGGYVDSAPDIIVRMLAEMGSADTQGLTIDTSHIAELEAAYNWECGFTHPGGSTAIQFSAVLDFLAQGVGLGWFLQKLTGKFDLVDLPPTTSAKVDKTLTVQHKAFSIVSVRAEKARRHVEVRFRRNRVVFNGSDEMDFFVRTDRTAAGQKLTQELTTEWQSAIFPASGTGEDLEPDILESPIFKRADALILAERLDTNVMGWTNSYYKVATTPELQAVEPWLTEVALLNSEDPNLTIAKAAYPVTVSEGPFGSTLVLLVIEST